MRTSEADIIIVPGLSGGTDVHWYSRWESKLPTAKRVIQADWHNPNLEAWTAALIDAVKAAQRPVVLVAHSLGVITVGHAAAQIAERVVGAFLVAPPSQAVMLSIPEIDKAFTDVPLDPLPFPAVLIASRDDSYAAYADSEALAKSWHVELVDAGESGHLNDESGHGPWPEGLMRFASFMRTL
ncbi:alpha/beta hydrolase [Beijerinckia sp. L45]|uniref:RBBP9/YdeN family alpha/beta hydrolase n=1 Tax=Beijerinckia sp. L45 TaxID=1641855 RepID=UPI00131D5797|nr:alpha/beta fold hydrolase [Beijerinckia sp. L45]